MRALGTARRPGAVRLVVVLAVALLCAAVATVVSARTTPVYSATARVVVATGSPGEPAGERAAAEQTYARTFAAVLDTPELAGRVVARTGVPVPAAELSQRTTLTAVPGTAVVEVAVEAGDPRTAAELATGWAQVAAADGPQQTGVDDARLTVAAPASAPTSPVRPRPALWIGGSAAVGALLAALVLLAVRPRRRGEADDGAADVPQPGAAAPRGSSRLPALLRSRPSWPAAGALACGAALALVAGLGRALPLAGPPAARAAAWFGIGAIAGLALAVMALLVLDRRRGLVLVPEDAASAAEVGIVVEAVEPRRRDPAPGAQRREPYRLLHEALAARGDLRVLLVLGASERARAGVRSIDIAVAAADAGARTVLVGTPGKGRRRSVADVLAEPAAETDAPGLLVPTDRPGLRVLPIAWPGSSDTAGRAAFGSRRLPLLLDRVRDGADLAVLAGPPLPDAEVALRLAGLADGALLVAVAGRWTRSDCRAAVDLLRQAGCPVAGIVLVRRGRVTAGAAGWEVRPQPTAEPLPTTPLPLGTARPASPSREVPPIGGPVAAAELARAVRAASAGSGRAPAVDAGTAVGAGAGRSLPRTEDGR